MPKSGAPSCNHGWKAWGSFHDRKVEIELATAKDIVAAGEDSVEQLEKAKKGYELAYILYGVVIEFYLSFTSTRSPKLV